MESTIAYGAGCMAGLAAFYRLARPHFSVRVNCHFCNKNTRVSYSHSNSFRCPFCDQYNGWDNDGDYNIQLGMGDQGVRFVREQTKVFTQENGLCRNCNLNQELKVSQLARFNKDGQELEEYRQHLERVYRLCAVCEDVLASKLMEQDRKLANKVLEVRLERSRLNHSMQVPRTNSSGYLLPYMQAFLAVAVFSLLQDYSQFAMPVYIQDAMKNMGKETWPIQMISGYLDNMFPFISFSELVIPMIEVLNFSFFLVIVNTILILVSIWNKSIVSIFVYSILLVLYFISTPHIMQLTLAGVGVIIAVVTTPPSPNNSVITGQSKNTIGVALHHFQQRENIKEVEDTLTQDLLDNSSSDSMAPSELPTTPSPLQRCSEPTIPLTSTPPTNTPMRTGNEFSFTHEFATQHDEDDCDLSSLSLGDIPTRKNTISPFSLSNYSPCSPTNSLFSPTRPFLQPSRLTNTSWVAGGYWTPPGQSTLQSPSRSSSHSSGFVSGTPSLANYPSPPGSLNNFCPPVYNHGLPDMDRFSVLSEPAYQFPHLPSPPRHYAASTHTLHHIQPRRRTQDDCVSNVSLDRHSQVSQTSQTSLQQMSTKSKSGWSLTITLTPSGLILATSIAVNVTLAVMWFRQGTE